MKPPLHFVFLASLFAGCNDRPSDPSAAAPVAGQSNPAQTTSRATTESNVTQTDPKDILFSTPTLNDALPTDLGPSAPGDDCFQMHEDDWRQFEFVSAALGAETASELAAIDRIWNEQSVPLGNDATAFRNVHIRQRIPTPLDVPMSVADYEKLFGKRASPMTLLGYEKVLRDVHAIPLDNVVVYAVIQNDRIKTLGLEPQGQFAITGDAADRLERFVTEHDLRLVHWRSRTLFETPQVAMKYLRGTGR